MSTRFLICDGNVNSRISILRSLSIHGVLDCLEASNSKDAIKIIFNSNTPIDVAFVDFVTCANGTFGANGLGLCTAIRRFDCISRHMILISIVSDHRDEVRCKVVGYDATIRKPISHEQMGAMLDAIIEILGERELSLPHESVELAQTASEDLIDDLAKSDNADADAVVVDEMSSLDESRQATPNPNRNRMFGSFFAMLRSSASRV